MNSRPSTFNNEIAEMQNKSAKRPEYNDLRRLVSGSASGVTTSTQQMLRRLPTAERGTDIG